MTVTTTIQAIGSSNNTLTEVEAATKAARESIKPGINIQRGGLAMVSARRSTLGQNFALTIGANSIIYAFRWGQPGYEARVRKINWGMSAVSYGGAGCLTIGLWRARIDRPPFDYLFDISPLPLTTTAGTNMTASSPPPSPLRSGMAVSANAPGSPYNYQSQFTNTAGAVSAAGGWTISADGVGTIFPVNTPGGDIVDFNANGAIQSGASQLRGLGNGQLVIDPNKLASTTVSTTVAAGGNGYGDTTCGGVANQNPAGLIKLWDTGAGDMPLCVEYGEGFVITLNTDNSQAFIALSDQTNGYGYQIHYEAVPLDLA